MKINSLIWDSWNLEHIKKHHITPIEVEEVCLGTHTITKSYRNRILVVGTSRSSGLLAIVLSPEDRNHKPYGEGIYYVITAFEKEVNI